MVEFKRKPLFIRVQFGEWFAVGYLKGFFYADGRKMNILKRWILK